MSSSRLPGKVLKSLVEGLTVLDCVVQRVSRASLVGEVIVATSSDPSDDVLSAWCASRGYLCFRGSLSDVLSRYYECASSYGADAIVRITGDCPLVDPSLIDELCEIFLSGSHDLVGLDGEFPDGLDCTVFSYDALKRAHESAVLRSEREHVCPFMLKNESDFKVLGVQKFIGLSNLRLTVDEPVDLVVVRQLVSRIERDFGSIIYADWPTINGVIKIMPDVMNLNAGIIRNEGYLRSLELDND